MAELSRQIVNAKNDNATARLLTEIPGIGPLFASRVTASVPDAKVFKSGRDFAAWLGLTPRQDTTGGKIKLGAITKKGDRALRRLLVMGAVSLLRMARKRNGALADWLSALRARKRGKVAAVALANKLARIVWAMMTTGEAFRTEVFART